jgi:hypothetical protein
MLLSLEQIAQCAKDAPPFVVWLASQMFEMKPDDPRLDVANRLYRKLKPIAQVAVRLELDYLRNQRRKVLTAIYH